MSALIQVREATQVFGTRTIFRDVSFGIDQGEVFVILGGSGCGKSTLLKQMIGLLPPTAGEITVASYSVNTQVEEVRRHIGVMFQSGALFGSMNLQENVSLPLAVFTDLPKEACAEIARLKLGLVGLTEAASRLPSEISGGMVKRAAIARALALDPPILMLDEPSAGLDPVTSAGLDRLILGLRDSLGTTFVVVTHELASIMAIADRCAMLDAKAQGLIALGKPQDLKQTATDPTVRAFFHRETL
ncbi:ABC transporter ATP-binding protein [Acidocella aminolytica]|jgi:phospholipid/cholesterol/gamma-HCH transport system ATP-binding protein|uniref:ABC transporter n=1 Tax=Acidocella aminolytica 101 = DSM 11237 TaxID=1120923 RepID=A0A0D6PDN5_9PROT|nr:ATP-binding cassette domain-containing protein [Acidocella aminolytica]GAN79870.1 ABC transporter [Acidocella aminolytica 101 = DSM 11237]GBQ38851.1 ABC transporter ATP-binding protein [Acidocella aminolytica 101 = DSM 11237]SHE60858.1 phospholipid/cholesterol/gamma-HCH transport system ATP-binding protein [Acidocella aminolytica 101 = DSM 11237]